MNGVDRAQLRHDQRDRAQAGRGGFGVRDRELNPDDAGSGLGHDLELFSELLVEGALEIGRQRLLVGGRHLAGLVSPERHGLDEDAFVLLPLRGRVEVAQTRLALGDVARRQQARVRPEKARRWRFHVGALGRGARCGKKGQTCEGER